MKKLFTGVFLLAAVFPLHAALDFYDSFNYSPTDVQLATAASPNWVAYPAPAGGVHPTNTAGSLSYLGLQTASGDNSVLFSGIAPAAGIAGRNLTTLYNIGNAPTLYYSLTFKVISIATADWGNTAANFTGGSFMLGFNQKLQNGTAIGQGDAAAPLLIRTGDPGNLSGTANDFQQYQLGTGVTATTATRTFDGTHNYNPGVTLFLVVSYTFGAGANDDVARLWVNPTPGSPEAANIPVVTTTAGALDVTGSQIQSFFLRNNSVEPSGTQIDDLRVGTTWADVTPPAGPLLEISRSANSVTLAWTTNANGFTLQAAPTLTPTITWSNVGTGTIVGDKFSITEAASDATKFYRLQK